MTFRYIYSNDFCKGRRSHVDTNCTQPCLAYPLQNSFDKAAITFSYALNFHPTPAPSHKRSFSSPQPLKSVSVCSRERQAVFKVQL